MISVIFLCEFLNTEIILVVITNLEEGYNILTYSRAFNCHSIPGNEETKSLNSYDLAISSRQSNSGSYCSIISYSIA